MYKPSHAYGPHVHYYCTVNIEAWSLFSHLFRVSFFDNIWLSSYSKYSEIWQLITPLQPPHVI